MSISYQSVLEFWFGPPDPRGGIDLIVQKRWFMKSDEWDQQILMQFGPWVERAIAGELKEWEEDPKASLALILLLDQFPRNIFRNSARSFAGDARALEIARRMLESDRVSNLSSFERVFVFLPLEHSEDIAMQRLSVQLFEKLQTEVPTNLKDTFQSFTDFARRHAIIIERFGRFPHRNKILGRTSTREEQLFLTEPGSGF